MSSAEIVGKRIKARAVYCSSLSKPALDKTIKDLKDGSNWKKYEATYGELIALFSWGDEIARIVGEKRGLKQSILSSEHAARGMHLLRSVFDAKGVSDDQKRGNKEES